MNTNTNPAFNATFDNRHSPLPNSAPSVEPLRALCDSSPVSDLGVGTSDLPNTSAFDPRPSAFTPVQDDYLQLSPLGLFPHARGFQNVDRPALEGLVKNFNSFFARLGRRFAGVPFYVGHPDVRGLENMYPDRKAYGWIMELEVREDGLYGRPKWSKAGRELIADGHYKFLSPYWSAERAGDHQGRTVFRPTNLISVGLTNEPNLPVLPLANAADGDGGAAGANLLGEPLELGAKAEGGEDGEVLNPKSEVRDREEGKVERRLPNAELSGGTRSIGGTSYASPGGERGVTTGGKVESRGATDEVNRSGNSPIDNLHSPLPNSPSHFARRTSHLKSPSALDPRPSTLENSLCPQCLRGEPSPSESSPATSDLDLRISQLESSLCNSLEASISDFDLRISNLEERFLGSLLDRAVAETRISPAERGRWRDALKADFENVSQELANARPRLNLSSRAESLPLRHGAPGHFEQKQRQMLALVNEKMRATGVSYHRAWVEARAEMPGLF